MLSKNLLWLLPLLLVPLMFQIHQLKTQEAIPAHIHSSFLTWSARQGRLYASPSEQLFRLGVYYKNYLKIQAMKQEKISFEMELNKFADVSEEEFRAKYLNLKEPALSESIPEHRVFKPSLADSSNLPEYFDWRDQGAVNEIVAQGECGSCWSFVGIVAVEGAWKIAGNKLEKFSEQQPVDCAQEFGAEGCGGGWMEYVYEYIIKRGGIERRADYPYVAMVQQCKENPSKYVGKLKDYLTIPRNDCKDMLLAITYNPIATAIDAGYMPFYKSGVYDYPHCTDNINHAVSIVGFGRDWANGKEYYTVRNTFGRDWGEEGYIKMDRNVQPVSGLCGLCRRSSFPIAAS